MPADPISFAERMCYCEVVRCVSGERLAGALFLRRKELWETNPRLAERIAVRISEAQRAHVQAHGSISEAERCLAEAYPELANRS